MKRWICACLLLLLVVAAGAPGMAANDLRKGVGKKGVPVYNKGLESLRNEDVSGKVASVAAQCRAAGKSGDIEVAMWLHDWLTHNANYDYTYTYYGADGVLLHGTGVCQSYTLAYGLLLDAFGIENCRVISQSMNHTWNLVKLEDTWYHIDVTWDDPGQGGNECQEYFGLSDVSMGRDHTWEWIVTKDQRRVAAGDSGYECPRDLDLGGVSLPEPVATLPAKPSTALELEDAGGQAYTMDSFSGVRTLIVMGRAGCGNTRAFLAEISRYDSLLTGARVVVGLVDDPSADEIRDFAASFSGRFLYTRMLNSRQLFTAITAAGIYQGGGIVFPAVLIKDVNDNYVYASVGYVSSPARVLSALLGLPATSEFECAAVDGGVEITRYAGFSASVQIPDMLRGEKVVSIGDGVFQNNSVLSTLTMPETVRRIGAYAFAGSALKSVTLPVGLTAIGDCAFKDTALTSLFLGEKITQIGAGAFDGATVESVQVLTGSYADTYMKQYYPGIPLTCIDPAEHYLTFELVDGTHYVVTGYKGSPVNLDIPSVWNGLPVTGVGQRALRDCDSLQSVTLREGIAEIGTDAFYDCDALKEVNLPATLTTLGPDAFSLCLELTRVTLPDNITDFADSAFDGGTDLLCRLGSRTASVIPCHFYDPGTPYLELFRDGQGLISVYGYDSFEVPAAVALPQGVQTVRIGAFSNRSGVESIAMPESVATLPRGALKNCDIRRITMPYALAKALVTEAEDWQVDIVDYLLGGYSLSSVERLSLTQGGLEVASWDDPGVPPVVLDADMVTLSSSGYPYTGAQITPGVVVKKYGVIYEEGADYLVSYGENIQAGRGSVTVVGQKRLKDSVTVYFDIIPLSLKNTDMTLAEDSVEYRGVPVKVGVALAHAGVALIEGTDYTLSFRNNADVGTATVEAVGTGNYTGTATKRFAIRYHEIPQVASSRTLTLPPSLGAVAAEAFMNTAAGAVDMRDAKVRSIGARAFSGCASLKVAFIPNTVTSIDKTAFKNCDSGLTLVLQKGSPLLEKNRGVSWADQWMIDGRGYIAVWG